MGGSQEFRAEPEAMRSAAGNVGGIIMRGVNSVGDLERLEVPPASFAGIGDAVAAAGAALQHQQVSAVRTLLSVMQEVNDLVRQCADEYQAADEAAAIGYGGKPYSAGPVLPAIWGTPVAAELAACAVRDSAGAGGEPGSVGNVLRYMEQAGLAEPGASFADAAQFNAWLEGNADNQASVGVIEVYSGTARDLGDVPGGVRGGDVVIVADSVIGVAGNNGQLYNHGLVDSDVHGPAKVSVYRPAFA
ncbi:WXG100 family type VII secretion target [Amycolatopsis sp. 195334CR]|uniref:WXG100 family type VII secretion target n=1 Tax=Amycolatopsis sp. 195334CR TaxID=2814588 RepID=UPI001A8DB81F|nr:WXG100 family type VII secretion target [Amycolatopsis sp. 195334CR]MBN6041745.1 WXG100 family type VII secretion target [Amycolatopsis sp. 195334CR]